MDIKIKIRKENKDETLNILKDLDFGSYNKCSISTIDNDIIIELEKDYVGPSRILKMLKKMIDFEDFSISFENNSSNETKNNTKKYKKSSVVSNDTPHDEINFEELMKDPKIREEVKKIEQLQYLKKNEKMFEILNEFLYESQKYEDFIEKISEYFQFGDRSYQFKQICTGYFGHIKISKPIEYRSKIHPICELSGDSSEDNLTITEKDIETRLGYTSLTLNFFKKKTEKNKVNFLELVNMTRKFKKCFVVGFYPQIFFRPVHEKTKRETKRETMEKLIKRMNNKNLSENDLNFIMQVFNAIIIQDKKNIEETFRFMKIKDDEALRREAEVSTFINDFWNEKTSGYIACNQFFDFVKKNIR